MLAAIDFDDQPSFTADEVENIFADRLLPDELMTIDATRA